MSELGADFYPSELRLYNLQLRVFPIQGTLSKKIYMFIWLDGIFYFIFVFSFHVFTPVLSWLYRT